MPLRARRSSRIPLVVLVMLTGLGALSFVAGALSCSTGPVAAQAAPQPVPESLYQEMHWRSIGPFRGGRTRAVAGVHGDPDTLYIGVGDGGVWRSRNYGRTWTPIFDDQPTQSIGAIAVAPSDPRTLYVASGEGLQRPDLSVGDGIYRSTDGGDDLDPPGPPRRPADPGPGGRSRATPTGCSRRCSATRTARTRSGACSARPTAARPGRRCSISTRTPAPTTSTSTLRTRTRSTPPSGRAARARGSTATPTAAATAASSSRPTAETTGRSSAPGVQAACRRRSSRRTWRSPRAVRSGSTRSWR